MPLGGLATAGLITAGAGLLTNIFGGIKAGQAANQMESDLANLPQYQRSKYPGQMLATAQNELNANNPFMAAQNRAILQAQANSQGQAAKASLDPTMLLKMTEAYNANANKAQQGMYQNEYAMRQQKLQQLAQAYAMNDQEDQNVYNNNMTAFNSKMNVRNAAAQTRVSAWQNAGNGLLAAGTTMIKGGMNQS